MNWLDITIVVVAIISALAGLWRGAIRAAFGIAGLIGGIVLAGRYYQPFADLLSPEGAVWAKIAAYAIILLATLALAEVIGWLLAHLVHVTPLGWLDRLIGFVLGAGIGLLFISAVLAVISKYSAGVEGAVASSKVAKFLMVQFPLLLALLPEEFDFIKGFFSHPQQVV